MNPDPQHLELLRRLDGVRFDQIEADEINAFVEHEMQEASNEQTSSEETSQGKVSGDTQTFDSIAKRSGALDRVIAHDLRAVSTPSRLADRLKAATRQAAMQDAVAKDAVAKDAVTKDLDSNEVVAEKSESDQLWASMLGTADTTGEPTSVEREPRLVDRNPKAPVDPKQRPRRSAFSRFSQRRSVVYVGLSLMVLTLMTGIGIAVVVYNQPPEVVSRERISHEAIQWKAIVDQQEWETDPNRRLDDYPLNVDLMVSANRWIELKTQYDASTVVYDVTPPGSKQVFQFTMHTNREFDLGPLLPINPIYKTSMYCIGASYENGVLYVIFVEGDEHRYRQVIRHRHPAG